MSDGWPELTARWSVDEAVEPGDNARLFLFCEALLLGEDPEAMLNLAQQKSDAARIILKLLRLSRESIVPPRRPAGRPVDPDRHKPLWTLVWRRLEAGMSLAEACEKVARILDDPKLLQREGFGAEHRLSGNGPMLKSMSPGSVANAFRKADEAAPRWFFDVIEGDDAPR